MNGDAMNGWGWGGMALMALVVVAIVVLVVWAISSRTGETGGARAVLDARLARGEIDAERYRQRLDALQRP